jgi:spore coat polysaccharide biosynthesis protein SpsF (cytidylyltransferase family)
VTASPHIGALIPVRLRSERLPGKALLPLAGRPMIAHLLDRVAASCFIVDKADVVVCTTTDTSDDPLVSIVEAEGCSVFRGSVDDIILRFSDAMARFGFDAVVQADGDDPLSATEYMDATMERLLADPSLDIVTVTGVPLGTATKSFTAKAMAKVMAAYRTVHNDTGFIYFFTKSGLCRHLSIEATAPEHQHATARLTLDYESDLMVFRRIFDALYRPGKTFGLAEVVRFLRAHPDIVEINRHVEKEYWARTAEKAVLEYAAEDGTLRRIPV